MVVLAASICTKSGKAIVSRQFIEMTRSRIEGLLASFPKLMGNSDQHTFVETENVRYVYQPLDDLFLVLVTNKNSNILQDIDTLHLFARVVSETCRQFDEREIQRHAFDLLSVFDEVIALGYRESVTLPQIRTIVEMESHEERIQLEIEKNKEKEAKDELKRKAKQIEMMKREQKKSGFSGSISGMSGFGNKFGGNGSGGYGPSSGGYGPGSMGGSGGSGGFRTQGYPDSGSSYADDRTYSSSPSFGSSATPQRPSSGKGMQLGKKAKDMSLLEEIKSDEGIQELSGTAQASAVGPAAGAQSSASQESVHVSVTEKIAATFNRDGGLQNLEIKGDMTLRVSDPDSSRLRLIMQLMPDSSVQYKTHPNVDKSLFSSDAVIAMKDQSRPFPTNTSLGLLKWRYASRDDSLCPLLITCWPSPTGHGACDVNIEYELQNTNLELHDVVISIPYPGGAPPKIGDLEGHYNINRAAHTLEWQLPLVDRSNASGVLEFSVQSEDVDGFYPIKVNFFSPRLICAVAVADIQTTDSGSPVQFSKETSLTVEDYSVV
ncbi:uncharacterized protein BJ171DRAFT_519581 [Polychytrium aggregatum]|uniref:uncharacterized protein n=1 Tax=Polychytrium aggregatum TaxID=110093 RepID=UPI0022FF1682|nr:uncharacterized protein BJ171DRAFT_519581 [Polychytrium aggregatum]KAI9197456.1 hypothetical protein BJ171DRAFT_519581 [Polychytrium aggregatum]